MYLFKISAFILLLSVFSCTTLNKSSFEQKAPVTDPSIKWENVDEVWATVGAKPVLKSDVEKAFQSESRQKNIAASKTAAEKSRILDSLINFIIIENKAAAEGIIVSKEKVDNQVKDIMKSRGISSVTEFEKYLEKNQQISLEDYREQLRRSIMTNLVMVYAVDYKRPTKDEAVAFYRQKMKEDRRPFIQVRISVIKIKPESSSFQDEKAANTEAGEVRKKAQSGTSFAALAKQYSDDKASALKGGDLGWVLLGQIDPYIAGYVYQKMSKAGSISEVIKAADSYYVIRYAGQRTAPFEEFENIIYNMLATQNGQKALTLWLEEQREFSDVKIFMKDYVKK